MTIDYSDGFYYITDSNLKIELHNQGFDPYDEGVGKHNNQQYWRYKAEAANIIHAWQDEQRNKKYSLNRWQL
ncbi:hypothetical protein KDC22_13275 [Paenibacillus tritici]|uniref:hypothetical protein n=1 Tax=Paenibacillus tritici TaxID=1873425 RepID=UPI001BA83D96|nr:hypothetical protein [Paenibacillus tritici]QUL57349.1 hypothetical protein KDC22_13275 [Paenibacillus tritici]